MKSAVSVIISLLFLIFSYSSVHAISDPLAVTNNKYGIHVIDENDLDSAAALVNSSSGDWGYITIVIPENEQKIQKWTAAFNLMKKLHLIPIIRLATSMHIDTWRQPDEADAEIWAKFLNQLPWFTKNRYVVVFNEPNHTKEWGGIVDPNSYANVLATFSKILKKYSDAYFILPAGLDASATNGKGTMDEYDFIVSMIAADPNIYDHIDGWTSHSYPNPNFSGNAEDRGRGSLATYKWELALLGKLTGKNNFPVFITETGWSHNENSMVNSGYLTSDQVADYIKEASETVWNDERIVAVTPFVLNYQAFPFASFSWQKQDSDKFYHQFDSYRSIVKIKGQPVLIQDEVSPTPSVLLAEYNRSDNLIKNSNVNIFSVLLYKSIRRLASLFKIIS